MCGKSKLSATIKWLPPTKPRAPSLANVLLAAAVNGNVVARATLAPTVIVQIVFSLGAEPVAMLVVAPAAELVVDGGTDVGIGGNLGADVDAGISVQIGCLECIHSIFGVDVDAGISVQIGCLECIHSISPSRNAVRSWDKNAGIWKST